MAPFSEAVSNEIRGAGKWTCHSCGKSSFDPEKWLIEASHIDHTRNEFYNDPSNGEASCIPCHLLYHIDLGDIPGVEKIANRIWNSGIRHFSEYEKNHQLMRDDRIMLSELLTASGISGRIQIDEKVHSVKELKQYINSRRRKRK